MAKSWGATRPDGSGRVVVRCETEGRKADLIRIRRGKTSARKNRARMRRARRRGAVEMVGGGLVVAVFNSGKSRHQLAAKTSGLSRQKGFLRLIAATTPAGNFDFAELDYFGSEDRVPDIFGDPADGTAEFLVLFDL